MILLNTQLPIIYNANTRVSRCNLSSATLETLGRSKKKNKLYKRSNLIQNYQNLKANQYPRSYTMCSWSNETWVFSVFWNL